MADVRFCVGFSSACKQAREGGGLPGCEVENSSGLALVARPFLPPDIVRLIDALVRRLEHEDTLLAMNHGWLGRTLCEAARAGGLRDVRFLLARGADVRTTTVHVRGDGAVRPWTALLWSAHTGRARVAALLLDAGAQAREPLVIAAQHGHREMCALLLDRGAIVTAQNDTPLRLASSSGHREVVELLLDRGANIHVEDDAPLDAAATYGHLETVRLLLDRGADIHALNNEALRSAHRGGRAAVVALLLERGAIEQQA